MNQEVIAELSEVAGIAAGDGVRERWAQANLLVDEMRSSMKGFMSAGEIRDAIEEGRR